ncbi:hypothetical protein VAE151_630441 [Vibrio aestuarianus]|uniref:Uncharacterized protein n=1 Tax=Vibrio aestuarianus TaxID=28171 RepID=A0ABM9FJ49_9VIBR|nr:hypothetical protein VAE063_1000439 [Vibrio aestuarianus]CAH8220222.1 hypothetical protein VAE308_1150388 [Vibrio aestuarianus]CAH8224950.1 hypothetical protein VAE055_420442 [Vibrio aestuarianus]CAH8236380.1 hypothetical protein VAE151_630441 [Vibrio aestuarianus]
MALMGDVCFKLPYFEAITLFSYIINHLTEFLLLLPARTFI